MYVCISLLTQRCPKRICTCFLGPWPSGVRRPWALVRSGGSADQLWRSQGWKGRRRTTTAAAATRRRRRTTTTTGTQVCNACTAFAFVCRLAHRTNQRLARLRQRETRHRHAAILEDVRKEIQEIHEARQTSMVPKRTLPTHRTSSLLSGLTPPRLHIYICPYCAKSVQSPVATGRVDHRRGNGCGKQFRVANGLLAGRTYSHACPTCGTVVHSTLASGRIRVTHRNPSGRQCRTNQWRVHTWWSFQLKVATPHGNAPHCFLNLQEK